MSRLQHVSRLWQRLQHVSRLWQRLRRVSRSRHDLSAPSLANSLSGKVLLVPKAVDDSALDFAAPGVALLNDRTDVGDTRGLGLFQDLVPDSRQAGGWDQSCHQDRGGHKIHQGPGVPPRSQDPEGAVQ